LEVTQIGFVVPEGEDPLVFMRRLLGSPYRAVPGAARPFVGVSEAVADEIAGLAADWLAANLGG
jgi:hypothetical protein